MPPLTQEQTDAIKEEIRAIRDASPVVKRLNDNARSQFVAVRFDVLDQHKQKLVKLGAAYITYLVLRRRVNRATGSKGKVWDDLDKLYNARILATTVVSSVLARQMDVSHTTIDNHISKLLGARLILVYPYKVAAYSGPPKKLIVLGWVENVGGKLTEITFEDTWISARKLAIRP